MSEERRIERRIGAHTAGIARGWGGVWVAYCVQCSAARGDWVTVEECRLVQPSDVPHLLIAAPGERR